MQKGMVTNLASPTELNRRSAIKLVKQQISNTFNTRPKEREAVVSTKQTNLTDLKPIETRNQVNEIRTPKVKTESHFGSGM